VSGKTLRMAKLMSEVYERLDFPYKVVKEVVIDFLNLMGEHLADGDSIVLKNVGSWKARNTKYPGRGPKGVTRIIHDYIPSGEINRRQRIRRVKKETTE